MLKLSKVVNQEEINFPVKDSDWDINKCSGYPYNCVNGFALGPM